LAISVNATLEEALTSMDEYHFHHLPVVDLQRRLVGIVSDLDIRRAADAKSMIVSDVMTPSPTSVTHNSPPVDALRTMLDRRFHSVPVLEGDRLIGIITTTDFLREFSYGAEGSGELISDHMLGDDHHVDSDATVDDAFLAMDELEGEFLAVLKGSCPVGVVSRRSLTVWLGFWSPVTAWPQGAPTRRKRTLATTRHLRLPCGRPRLPRRVRAPHQLDPRANPPQAPQRRYLQLRPAHRYRPE
jgi:CBS domain-containing protein